MTLNIVDDVPAGAVPPRKASQETIARLAEVYGRPNPCPTVAEAEHVRQACIAEGQRLLTSGTRDLRQMQGWLRRERLTDWQFRRATWRRRMRSLAQAYAGTPTPAIVPVRDDGAEETRALDKRAVRVRRPERRPERARSTRGRAAGTRRPRPASADDDPSEHDHDARGAQLRYSGRYADLRHISEFTPPFAGGSLWTRWRYGSITFVGIQADVRALVARGAP